MADEDPTRRANDQETVEELAADAVVRNPDETTRREALELELEEEGRSDEGAAVGDEID